MKNLIISAILALAPGIVLAQAIVPKAATSVTKKNNAKPKAPVVKAKPAAKAPTKTAAGSSPPSNRERFKSGASQIASGIRAADAALSPEELEIANRVYVGDIPCELGARVNVTLDAAAPGHFQIDGKGFRYRMTPVATSTGAVRLEDREGGAVWLQISNKSMLMDQKRGQRLADDCMSPAQVAVAESLKKAPARSLLDEPVK